MERWAGLGVAATVFVLVVTGALTGQQQKMTGNIWKDLPDYTRLVYAMGFIDGMVVATQQPGLSADIAKCTDRMSYGQIEAIVSKYIADHPEMWHRDLFVLAPVALLKACGRP